MGARKTWRDFDLKVIRQVFDEVYRSKNVSDEEKNRLFEVFMERAVEELDISVPCATCGIKYPLNQLEHDCAPEDVWVNAYVHNASCRKTGYEKYITKLQAKYPCKVEGRFVFRGKNFETMDEYESFMESIQNGYYEVSTVTSWTTEYEYAVKFARFMQKGGTSASDTVRRRELLKMLEQGANMTGCKGVVLRQKLRRESVLCDISNENIGGFDEHEIILLPGRYRVEVVKTFDRQYGVEWTIDEQTLQLAGII
jgi:hypothetical protein